MDPRKRILEALALSGKTQLALAARLGVSRGAVSEMLKKESGFDSLKYLEATAELTGFRFEWLRTGKGPEKEGDEEAPPGVQSHSAGNELAQCLAEKEKLKFEIEILRSALRDIGEGKKKISNEAVAPKINAGVVFLKK